MEFGHDMIYDDQEEFDLNYKIEKQYEDLNNYIEVNEGLFGVVKGIGKVYTFISSIIKKILRMMEYVISLFYSKINKLKFRNKVLHDVLVKYKSTYKSSASIFNTDIPFKYYGTQHNINNIIGSSVSRELNLIDSMNQLMRANEIGEDVVGREFQIYKSTLSNLESFANKIQTNSGVLNIYQFGGDLYKQNEVIVNNAKGNDKLLKSGRAKIKEIEKYITNHTKTDDNYGIKGAAMHQRGLVFIKKYISTLPKFKIAINKIAITQLETTKIITKNIKKLG